ncbi:MAG: hypothetical protein MUE67_07625 [Anaerolineales bacterium]|nr:hypothetical protein [Anaerolineales bacterium]
MKSLQGKSNLVLSQAMTTQMLIPQVSIEENWGSGLGFDIVKADGMTRFGCPGWNEGFHSVMIGCLETRHGIIWMTNGETGRRLGLEVSHGLAEAVRWLWW